ncbi:MAG: hypothetical protein AAF501_18810 [Pseudomonadota bacterium]
MRAHTAILATVIAVSGLIAGPSAAGILINPKGIFLTEPEVPAFVVGEDGQARFGGPATGFRRFGRSGFFPLPQDPGLFRSGQASYGPDGFEFAPLPHGKIEMQLSDVNIFFWLD